MDKILKILVFTVLASLPLLLFFVMASLMFLFGLHNFVPAALLASLISGIIYNLAFKIEDTNK